MTVKIIIYERKNYLLDSFNDVLESENYLDIRRNFLGANFPFLNYP